MKKTPWVKIKADYLAGILPKQLAEKYKIKSKAIRDKANNDGWVAIKAKITNGIETEIMQRVNKLAREATSKITKGKIADEIEVLEALTDIARGDKLVSDRQIKALELLGKKHKLFTDKIEQSGSLGVTEIVINRKSVKKDEQT